MLRQHRFVILIAQTNIRLIWLQVHQLTLAFGQLQSSTTESLDNVRVGLSALTNAVAELRTSVQELASRVSHTSHLPDSVTVKHYQINYFCSYIILAVEKRNISFVVSSDALSNGE